MIYKQNNTAKWRKYQARLQRTQRIHRFKKKLPFLITISGSILGLFFLIFLASSWFPAEDNSKNQTALLSENEPDMAAEQFSRKDLTTFLNGALNDPSTLTDQWGVEKNGSRFTIKTTIDAKLQKYIVRLLRRPQTMQSAIVVSNPFDGRILAMASYDMNGKTDNLCLSASFPAASLFKIVSAAAALESAGYTPDKRVNYVGSKHTLYKYQLERPTKRTTRQTNFRKAFASSNNSVFGKLGIYDLGRKALTDYADRFFFNRVIPFDIPMTVSTIEVPENEFGLAEISSGFNKQTLISPLHAALLAAVVVNNGELAAPWLVDSITYKTGEIFYQARCQMLTPPIDRGTAANLKVLMGDSAISGTSRSVFRRLRQKRKFKNLDLGAKTGTINDKNDRFKYDWISAYALSPDGNGAICISVLGVHGKKLGVRSTEFARAIIDYYFSSTHDGKEVLQ
jgi:cell division protein FtsI/penicillin-binding protein 2